MEQRRQRGRRARECTAQLDAFEADLLRIAEHRFKRRVAAQLGHVIVDPRNRADPKPDRHIASPFDRARRTCVSYSARAADTAVRSEVWGTATSHQAPPASVLQAGSVSVTITVLRPTQTART